MLISNRGELSKDTPKLIFNRYQNRRFLSKLLTEESGIEISMTVQENNSLKKQKNYRRQIEKLLVLKL